jgi:hypothetical protein
MIVNGTKGPVAASRNAASRSSGQRVADGSNIGGEVCAPKGATELSPVSTLGTRHTKMRPESGVR